MMVVFQMLFPPTPSLAIRGILFRGDRLKLRSIRETALLPKALDPKNSIQNILLKNEKIKKTPHLCNIR